MQAGRDRGGIGRIVALLLSLAGLADRAAGRSLLTRFLVLLVLRPAEAVARDYLADVAQVDGLWFDDGLANGCSPADATLLAQRFETLAAVLGELLESEGPLDAAAFPPRAAEPRHPFARHPFARRRFRWPAAPRHPAPFHAARSRTAAHDAPPPRTARRVRVTARVHSTGPPLRPAGPGSGDDIANPRKHRRTPRAANDHGCPAPGRR